jgi:Ca-activated chloride channel family protein
VIEDYRAYIKRPANIVLVVDTSGSMADASKLPKVQQALTAFIGNIKGQKDRLGLIDFAATIKYNSGVQPTTADYKTALVEYINSMTAGGNTAVLDSVLAAYDQLQSLNDSQGINAIVVMTDGKENASTQTDESKLLEVISGGKVPVVIFSIAFGQDADTEIMKSLAAASNGQFRQAESINIEDLYKIISTYF